MALGYTIIRARLGSKNGLLLLYGLSSDIVTNKNVVASATSVVASLLWLVPLTQAILCPSLWPCKHSIHCGKQTLGNPATNVPQVEVNGSRSLHLHIVKREETLPVH